MLKIYGSMLCPDCVECRKDLDTAGVEYQYHDIGDDLRALKEFLKLRDSAPIFDAVREAGSIGIPTILLPDGTVTLEWDRFCK